MGWGRTLLLGDIGNRLDIQDCEQDIGRMAAGLKAGEQADIRQDQRLEMLEADNRELKLYLATAIRLLVAKGVVSAEEFSRFVRIIDRSDGAEDGQFGGDVASRGTWGDGASAADEVEESDE